MLVAAVAPAGAGGLSAYEALFEIGRVKGNKLLANVTGLHGADAAPQPAQWTVTFKDDEARGGIREFVVNEKGIAGERTPLQAGDALASGVMAASALKVDSTGIFTKANVEASRAKLGFDTLDYRLRNVGGSPVWTVRLMDVEGNEAGVITFSAKDGTIVTPLKTTPKPTASATPTVAEQPSATASSSDQRPLGQRWVEGGGLVGHVDRWGRRTWKVTSETAERTWETTGDTAGRVGDTIGAFFTGRPPKDAQSGH